MKKTVKALVASLLFFAFMLLFSLFISCRQEGGGIEVDGLSFIEQKISMKVGQQAPAKINISPSEARPHTTVRYSASAEGRVVISEQSNDGCVLTALAGPDVIVKAEAGNHTAYLTVNIEHTTEFDMPYIVVPTQVIEVLEGQRKTVEVSLFNGNAVEQQQFAWSVEQGKDNISILPTGNKVVVTGDRRGSQKIFINHAQSEFQAEILVFVTATDESVLYITTKDNVITMFEGGETKMISASLVNGNVTDKGAFTFTVVEGGDVIAVLSANETCSINAIKEGTGVIRIWHPRAEYDLDVRVIVSASQQPYIALDKMFQLIDIGESVIMTATVEDGGSPLWINEYGFNVEKKDIIDVIQASNQFHITGKKAGSSVLSISNWKVKFAREMLVVVRDPREIPPDDYYITTSQNIIQLDMGMAIPTQLTMLLVNGTEDDRNDFEWTVEDGRIINVESPHTNKPVIHRSMVEIRSVFEALAYITPKMVGQTRITVTHPLAKAQASVIVKVYPKGTFAGQPFILDRVLSDEEKADKEGAALIKVDTTKADKKIQLMLKSGDENGVGNLEWKITPEERAGLRDLGGLENYITGRRPPPAGVGKLAVTNQNLKYPYEAVLMVGTTEELAQMSVLYADNMYHSVAVGQSVSVQIKDSNGIFTSGDNFTAEAGNRELLSATMIQSRLLLQGIREGNTTVTVKHRTNAGVVPVTLTVNVEPAEISISRPYTISGPNFFGMYVGQTNASLKVSMDNATELEKGRVQWESKNNAAVRVTGNGLEAFASAYQVGQSNVVASHDRAQIDGKTIVVYVVATEADLANAVVLGIEKQNWLLKPGEEVLMSLITNADPNDAEYGISKISWGGNDPDIVKVDYNGDKALVKGVGEGSTVIRVSHPRKVIDLTIYISVSSKESLDKSVVVPSIIEMIIDENKVVQAVCNGLSESERKAITWAIDDPVVADITGDGDTLYIRGRSRNQAWITVNVPAIGYTKKILLLCKASYDDVMYVFSANETYYKIKAGEQKRVDLIFGSAGFPENEIGNIEWIDVDNNKVVRIPVSAGASANIIAENEGIAKVRINHKNNLNVKPLELTFEVYKDLNPDNEYEFVYNSILGLVLDPADELHSKIVTVGIVPQGLSYSQITWRDEKENEYDKVKLPVITVDQTGMGNEFVVTAVNQPGQTYLRIEREQVYDPARILVYTAEDREALEAMYPLALAKQNYLLAVGGQRQRIEIKTIDDDPVKINRITWAFSDNSIINDYSYPLNLANGQSDRRVREIDGRNPGNCTVNISYNGTLVEKVYISVKTASNIDQSKKITTESIIGLNPGGSHTTSLVLSSNITADEINSLEWESGDTSIVKVTPVSGNNAAANLTAVWTGTGERETEVTVSLGQIRRHIKVYVSGNVEQYKAVNLDNRYYQLRMGDNFTLSAFHHYLDTKTDDQWNFVPEDNNVIKIDRLNPNVHNKIQITGLNEGVATVELGNPNSSAVCTPVLFHIEVSKSAPLITDNTDDWYLTAIKTVYAVDPAKVFDLTRLSVIGVKFPPEEAAKIKWEIIEEYDEDGTLINYIPEGASRMVKNPEWIEILGTAAGEYVDIRPNNKKGKAVLRVSHAKSANDLRVTVWCDVGMIPTVVTPYIDVNEEIVKLQINAEKQITLSVANMANFDIHAFKIRDKDGNPLTQYTDDFVEAKLVANVLLVKGNVFGQTQLTISHDAVPDMQKRILVLILSGDSDLVYLTTTQNFNVVQKTEYVTINIDLVGYDDYDNRNFEWINDNPELISINYSGKTAVVRGLDIGTAKIIVYHRYCQYVLNIYVRVTEQTFESPIYVTTPNNIISIKRSESMQVKASLVNGLPQETQQFQWGTNDGHLIELQASGDTARITGKGVGTAMVSIGHPSSLNVITMLVVVEEIVDNYSVYIVSSDSLLVEMSTAETQRKITARLTGANPGDEFGLQWTITNYSSLVKNQDTGQSYPVVSVLANGDTCYIQPVRVTGYGVMEGEAIVTVKHPKTSHRLDFKVIVTDNTAIQFQESYITMTEKETVTVKVQSPANRVIRYSSSDKSVVEADGTNTMCILKAKKEGTAIISAYDVGGTKSDQIIVKVNAQTLDRPYINARTFVLLSRQQPQGTSISAKLLRAGDDSAITEAYNQNLYWTVDNASRVTLAGGHKNTNYPAPYNAYIFGDEIGIQPGNVGDAEITVGYYHPDYFGPNNNANHQSYKDYPELRNAALKIYVRVNSSGTSVVIDPSVFTLDWSQSEGRIVSAKVTGESNVDYGKDIRWVSDDENIARVIPHGFNGHESVAHVLPASAFENAEAKSGPVTIRAYYEKDGTQADYGTATAVVTPRRLLSTSIGSILVTPDSSATFTSAVDDKNYGIYCYPDDEQLLVTATNNAYFTFSYDEKFETDPATGKTAAKRTLVISGTPVEGAGNVILTGKTYGLKTQIMVTNTRNQNIVWQNGENICIEPEKEETKLFMLTPEQYRLKLADGTQIKITLDGYNSQGAAVDDKDAELIITQHENSGNELFKKYLTVKSTKKSFKFDVHFDIVDKGEKVEAIPRQTLNVYVGYRNISIDFTPENISKVAPVFNSSYDNTQSSIRLVGNRQNSPENYGLKLTLTAKSGDKEDANVTVHSAVFKNDQSKDLTVGRYTDKNTVTLFFNENELLSSSAFLRGSLYRVNYVGVLTVTYSYYGYNGEVKNQIRNFLVYHDQYYW